MVSLKFLSFCSASSSNKATFLNKLSRSPRAPLSSFSSPLNFSIFSSCSSSFFSRSSFRCVRDVISWSLAVVANSRALTFAFNSSIFSLAASVSARRALIFYSVSAAAAAACLDGKMLGWGTSLSLSMISLVAGDLAVVERVRGSERGNVSTRAYVSPPSLAAP